ncbi:hypothetical protein [Streptomyces sp. WM6378]|uniref:hypothetical protein n=1 Tax=Streptomyces sp. WM6378 TaxID=1415557 RepID=UPI001F403580|nr:hypothetical protein [Streptomyces sp. WM6378]
MHATTSSRMVTEGRFDCRHVVGIPIGEKVAGLLIVDVDIEAAGQNPRLALLGQMPIA